MTKDELFTLEDSLAQAVFVSMMNSRYVSVKQGLYYYQLLFYLHHIPLPLLLETTQMLLSSQEKGPL